MHSLLVVEMNADGEQMRYTRSKDSKNEQSNSSEKSQKIQPGQPRDRGLTHRAICNPYLSIGDAP